MANVRRLLEFAERNGWEASYAKKHIKLSHPKIQQFIFISKTPSDRRTDLNSISIIKRYMRNNKIKIIQ